MKLISMTDYVLEQDLKMPVGRTVGQMVKYGLFLKQSLEIWMFVPCKLVDGVWVILEEPVIVGYAGSEEMLYDAQKMRLEEYQQAKERVLFEGFEFQEYRNYPTVSNGRLKFIFDEYGCWLEAYDNCEGQRINNIERLTQLNLSEEHLQLTPTAIKQIGI